MLQHPVGAPPLDLAPRGLGRVERLALPRDDHAVEALHVAAGAIGVVVGIRRPELVGAEDPPAAAHRVGQREAEGLARQAEGRAQQREPSAAVVGDPGIALELADAPGIEGPHPHLNELRGSAGLDQSGAGSARAKASDGCGVGGATCTQLPPSVFAV